MDLAKQMQIFVAKFDLFVTDVLPYILIGLMVIIGGLVILTIVDAISDILERKRNRRKR